MTARPPTDAELDAMIMARLASMGIDLTQLAPGTASDPETGSPGRDAALRTLRSFVRGTVERISEYMFPAVPGGTREDASALSQQTAVPTMYPSIESAWRQS